MCLQVLPSLGLPNLKEYRIVCKFSCLETFDGTNQPRIAGKKFKIVHFVRIELPSKVVVTVAEDYLARADPRYYHERSSDHWEWETKMEKVKILSFTEHLEKIGLGADLIKSMRAKWEDAYLGDYVFPVCPCGGEQTVRERVDGGVVRLNLQCHADCTFSQLIKKSWSRRPFPSCPVCRDRLGKTIPLMMVDNRSDGMGMTNFLCEICHNSIDKLSVWMSDLMRFINK